VLLGPTGYFGTARLWLPLWRGPRWIFGRHSGQGRLHTIDSHVDASRGCAGNASRARMEDFFV